MMTSVYIDPESGRSVITHSMMTTMRRCPAQFEYKYLERLKPRRESTPLRRGKWIHALLEEHYRGGDWKEPHAKLSAAYGELFDEEQDALGDLPTECARLMTSYLWHWRENEHPVWKIHEVEAKYDVELPDGRTYRCRIDLLAEDDRGLIIVDHKSHKTLPDFDFRLMDSQNLLYIWALRKLGYNVNRFVWNYLRTKAPTVPQLLQDGSRLSKKAIETDYPTARRAIERYGLPLGPHKQWLLNLQNQRYHPDRIQTSPFFKREWITRSDDQLERMAASMIHTALRIEDYPWEKPDLLERVPSRDCRFRCSYTNLCGVEVIGGNADNVRRLDFKAADPLDYYNETKDKAEV